MKTLFIFSLSILALSVSAEVTPPHIGPEGLRFNKLHIYKVEKLIENRLNDKALSEEKAVETKDLAFLLAVGKRATGWIDAVNAERETNKLDLSNPQKSGGIPMTAPNKVNTEILMKRYQDYIAKAPTSIAEVISSSGEFPKTPPVSDKEFVDSLRTLDRIYQATVRWSGAGEWMDYYIGRAMYDVRGYVFLRDTPNLKEVLLGYSAMSKEDQAKYAGWLLSVCKNGDFDSSDCSDELKKYLKRNNLYGFYTTFSKYGKSMYDLFFSIKATRPEVSWNAEGTVLNSPFKTPDDEAVKAWLKENVEDEWKGENFNLIIDYKKTTEKIPRIQFKTTVTANVNGIAGDLITMSSDYPINTIDQKYTIRHEYGHVLGFEDCYLEFFDTKEKAMIYYEVDVNNIMCSRNGRFQNIHIEKLKNAYN